MYYRGATAALIVYDVTNEESFKGAKTWIEELRGQGKPNVVIILVGNKYDLLEDSNKREVDVADYLNENSDKIHFYQASCKTGKNINEIFECAANESHKIIDDNYSSTQVDAIISRNYVEKDKKCCAIC